MKKVFLTLAVVFGMIASANAQLVVGGGLSFGGGVSSTKQNGGFGDQFKTSNFNFGFAPKVGYIINEKVEVGGILNLGYSENTTYTQIRDISDPANPGEARNVKDFKRGSFKWDIMPYARYRCFEYNGFGFWIEGVLSLGTETEGRRTFYAYGSDKDNAQRTSEQAKTMTKTQFADGHKYLLFNGAFYVQPVITYTINEHWVLDFQLELLSLGLGGSVQKTTDKGMDIKGNAADITTTNNDFAWGLGLMQNRGISFGAAYKF
jgi:hypothetical protein